MKPPAPLVIGRFHKPTCSIEYLVIDEASRRAIIIDPVMDYDEKAGRLSTQTPDSLLADVAARGLTVDWILDTHPHADHFSAAPYLKQKLGAPIGTGAHVVEVQRLWREIYNTPDLECDGSQWDRLFADGETFSFGNLSVNVMHSPGHTLASVTYVVGDAAFVHDTLFQPDWGTARADFPGGSAESLYDSIMAILALPDDTRLFTGHDYQPGGRPVAFESTVLEQRTTNPHLKDSPSREAFAARRHARDAELPMPKLILHALQVNLRAGRLPEPEANGRRYLKIPLDAV